MCGAADAQGACVVAQQGGIVFGEGAAGSILTMDGVQVIDGPIKMHF